MTENKAGFTLIELLVVVLIIGILAAVALPQYQKAVFKSQYHALIPMTDALYQAEVLYYLEHGVYTDEFNKLDIGIYTDKTGWTKILNGHCSFSLEDRYVFCRNPTLKFSYLRKFDGKRYCVVYDNDAKSHKLCQDETKKETSVNGVRYAY